MNKFRNIAFLLVLAMAGTVSVSAQAAGPDEKKFLVSDMVEATHGAFPADFFRKAAAEGAQKGLGDLNKTIEQSMIRQIDADQQITEAQRAEAKSKVPAFSVRLAEKTLEIAMRGLDIDTWVKEALAYSYSKSMTTDELRQLKGFLDSPDGKAFLAVLHEEALAKIENRTSNGLAMIAGANVDKVSDFISGPVGTKFLAVFESNTSEFLENKTGEWAADLEARITAEIREGELRRMIVEFRESIVKPKP